MNSNKFAKRARAVILVVILAFLTYEFYQHQVLGGGASPSVHALCPYGALESLYALIFTGTFIKKIYLGTLMLFLISLALALLFRRSFCGLICPFGALQELFAKVGLRIFRKRLLLPKKSDALLRYLKYAVLALTVFMAWYYGSLWMAPFDPYSAYAHILDVAGAVAEEPLALVGFVLLAVTLIGSIFYDRFFCKYACPAGAFYALVGKASPTYIERNNSVCIHCNACSRACPMNIDVAKAGKVKDLECINCNECVISCPKKGALEIKSFNKVTSPLLMLFMVLGIFFGGIFLAQALGYYQTIPVALGEGQVIPISELKGYMTIEEAALVTGLPLPEVYSALKIPEQVPKHTRLKEIYVIVPGYSFDDAKSASVRQ